MDYKPFKFMKSYEERLSYFNRILSPSSIKTSAIKAIWSNCVDFIVDPLGWLAIWKISRNLCIDLNIYFPCCVIIYVEQVNPTDLSCLVSIREVEDETIQLPERMADVPLIELYPLEQQDDSSALRVSDTAELLDNLRFFYKHIWMPWDLESECDDDNNYWVEKHLQPRLELHFSLMERKWPYVVGYKVHHLVKKGCRAVQQIEDLEADMEDDNSESDGRLLQLTELHHSLVNLKNQYSVYENSGLLKAQLEKTARTLKDQELKSGSAEVNLYCVLSLLTQDRLAALSDKVQQYLADDKKVIRMFTTLQEVLAMVPAGANIWLTRGEHAVYDLGALESGGAVTGVEDGVVMTQDSEGSCSLDLMKGSLNLTSLTIRLATTANIINVRPGTVCSLRDVRLEGSPVIDGIDIFTSASLSAINCHFVNFFTAISCDTQASLHLSNCTFSDNKVALQLKHGCSFTMENCTLDGSKQFGILLAVPRPIKEKPNSINFINSVDKMKESGSTCCRNAVDIHLLCDSWNVSSLENNLA